MLNGMKYYGWDDIEFHLLYWPSKDMTQFIDSAMAYHANLIPINLLDMRDEQNEYHNRETGAGLKATYFLKFYRSLYCASLTDYDAVAYLDADRFITHNLTPYFRLAYDSGKIVMPDYRFSQQKVDDGFYAEHPIQGTNGCPYDPSATFFDPRLYGKYYEQVAHIGLYTIGRSEMPSVNYVLITNELYDNVIRLPALLWNMRKLHQCELSWERYSALTPILTSRYYLRVLDGQHWPTRYLNIDPEWCQAEDDVDMRVYTIHGRYHFRATMQKKIVTRKILEAKPNLIHQSRVAAEYLKVMHYFNFEYGHRSPVWYDNWFSEGAYADLEKGVLVEP
jgi:hypothetical protein